MWIDELCTTERARGRGIARWLLWQVARGQRVELQVSCDTGHMAERARRSYRSMGIDRMRRGRSRVVESAEDGYELWFTEEYCVTSGWEPDPEFDAVAHSAWSVLGAGVQEALIGAVVRAHGYGERRAREHMAGWRWGT